nr:MAG TPA: hypothetical protein [Bacteriophage sp.]
MYVVSLIFNLCGLGRAVGISGISLVLAGVYPKAEVTLALLSEIVPEDSVILLPTLIPPSTELVAVGRVYVVGIGASVPSPRTIWDAVPPAVMNDLACTDALFAVSVLPVPDKKTNLVTGVFTALEISLALQFINIPPLVLHPL